MNKMNKIIHGETGPCSLFVIFFSFITHKKTQIKPSRLLHRNVPPSLKPASNNFCCIANLLSPLHSVYLHCQTYNLSLSTLPPLVPQSISSHGLHSSKEAPFPQYISLFFSLHPPHCLPTHPLVFQPVATQQGDSSQQPGRNSQHRQAREHTNAMRTRACTSACTHAHINVQSNRKKQDSDTHSTTAEMEKNWRAAICYFALI